MNPAKSVPLIIINHGKHCVIFKKYAHVSGSVVAERLRAPNSNSGVSDQQSVGSNPQAVCPLCCVLHVKQPSALIEKSRVSPR